MILSMTGYGKSVSHLDDKKITVEVRTLNSKNLDLNLRLSSELKELELPLRQMAARNLKRGKVDVAVHFENTGTAGTPKLNLEVLVNYMDQLGNIKGILRGNHNHDIELLEMATRFPDVFDSSAEELSEDHKSEIVDTVEKAIELVNEFRAQEGNSLQSDFQSRISSIKNLLDQVKEMDKERLEDVRTRLEKAVQEIKERVDENRFEQELIYYLEKYDITEEKVRLANHLDYFTETMELPESQGKKLGFISQEIGREINTIGSKANHAAMQQLVVQMKDELEKIKEQLLNVL
ncbi:YicC family protein [Nonlabens spongiae]|uniref:YicC family protein n=1 Tax=Nonlabens spongiae TaxID=331648 RepID=A0A1W6MLS2_9FLAO|nr:YicC/YloC family endoribonuclease [Nonlabens spongiae]ARN78543.1 YicC family protein [Nonlabens spongiae]